MNQTYGDFKKRSSSFGTSAVTAIEDLRTDVTTPILSQPSRPDKRSDVPQPRLRSLRPSGCGTEELARPNANPPTEMIGDMIAMIARQVVTMLQPQLRMLGAEYQSQQGEPMPASSSKDNFVRPAFMQQMMNQKMVFIEMPMATE